jgi:GT2 family glycosyltransferase
VPIPGLLRLPEVPSHEVVARNTPPIAPLVEGGPRPLWSVMIPTYNGERFLARTIESVLNQDPGPAAMQIEVVDCGSTTGDPERVTRETGRGRVSFARMEQNQGIAHSLTTCIERARGHWLHILHDDDLAGPGFYDAYGAAIRAHPEVVMVGGPATQVDEADRPIGTYGPSHEGLMPDFVTRQAVRQLLLFNAVVARRDAYERAGGFSRLFPHACDWDMWFRLGLVGPVAWVSRPFAWYRVHPDSDTARHQDTAANIRDSYLVVQANLARLRALGLPEPDASWRTELAGLADVWSRRFRSSGNPEGEFQQARWAMMLEPRRWRLRVLLSAWLRRLWRTAS